MATIQPFRAFRPAPAYQASIPALPYDVMNTQEARQMAAGNPLSFLHVDRPEIDLAPDTDPSAPAVYAKAGENLKKLMQSGALVQEQKDCFYLYRQTRGSRSQTGLVLCAAIDDYLNNVIKKHEHTRSEKEADRVRHVDACNAHTGPIFLTYRQQAAVTGLQNSWAAAHAPVYDFVGPDGVKQQVWVVDDTQVIEQLRQLFASIASLYIADGHHRCAAAVRVGQQRRAADPAHTGAEPFNYFLAVAFADTELEIMDYNRVAADLNGCSEASFLSQVREKFLCSAPQEQPIRPAAKHQFSLYLNGKWYALTAKDGTFDPADPVAQLDVSILQNNLLEPILGIRDPKTDQRIDFIGGIRGLKELERRAQTDMQLAFALYPTTVQDLMAIADAGQIMPPKSTWFEPKLLSGIFIHALSSES